MTHPPPTMLVAGTEVPVLMYGTAWKEERTEGLVGEALAAGFRAVDTANQRRHYHEVGAGAAIANAIRAGAIHRHEIFIQTKFTHVESQDHRLPYDPGADLATQVRQSFESSLEHLGVDRLDSYVLHGPRARRGLSTDDVEAWRAIEQLQREGRVRFIGISNVTAEQLALLVESADLPPAFVQNRCFARLGWDRKVREVCRREGVVYQGFSLLTANVSELGSETVRAIARAHRKTIPQVAFRFAIQLGMIALTGTISPEHMREDLDVFDFELSREEMQSIETISVRA